ncbi:MAG: chorismate mutase [Lachnospiraceae bacterium]|jgi:chorismate mutase/prephenate dehydratase|nr:chorismate mutase [Lachnospiraceae bacterium]
MLDEIRKEIDSIDDQIKELFEKRMECVSKAAAYKAENQLPTLDTAREREIVARVTAGQPDEFAGYTKTLFNTIFDLSRSYQGLGKIADSQIAQRIHEAVENTPKLFPQSSVVACQGIEGAYSQFACEKLFSRPSIMYFNSFDAVFNAVDKGLCKNGILPVENSLHGSVTEVYDLMKKYRFYIARSVKMKINHALLAKAGAGLPQIKEIYSHEQALMQCSEFIKGLSDIKIIDCKNTAAAAKMVADSDRNDIAAISNPRCADLYGLSILSGDVQNNANNYTRFICITKDLEIYPGSDKISLMFTVPHKPGALYGIMSKFASLGVNLTKLESRPIPEMDFEFMFYVELEASVYSEEIVNLISHLDRSPEQTAHEHFAFLGSYSEI